MDASSSSREVQQSTYPLSCYIVLSLLLDLCLYPVCLALGRGDAIPISVGLVGLVVGQTAFVAIIVNDASFEKGNDFQLPPGCVADGSDHTGKKSTYMLHIPCISSCDLSAAPSTAP